VAGVDDQLDWTAPRDIAEPFYQVLSMTEGDDAVLDPDADYYTPIP
jgi:hypothetical protein